MINGGGHDENVLDNVRAHDGHDTEDAGDELHAAAGNIAAQRKQAREDRSARVPLALAPDE